MSSTSSTSEKPDENTSQTYSISIPSNRKNITLVESFLTSIPQFKGLNEAMYYNVLIALTEAVNNAIIHGNKLDESKNADITATIYTNSLTIWVRDYGAGFNPDLIPDPRNEENLMREGGRGVFLITSLIPNSHYTRMNPGMLLEMKIQL